MSSDGEYNKALEPLSWLFGRWKTIEAEVSYPTMNPLSYIEEMEFLPTSQPVLQYKSQTWHSVKKCLMHCESGFLRIHPETKMIAFMIAHNFGLTELSEGELTNQELNLTSTAISCMSFAKTNSVTKLCRHLELRGEELVAKVSMETLTQPLQQHLVIKYKKVP